jgi:hypothetical protein
VFSHIDLDTGGTKTRLVGDTSLTYFPEQMYRMESEIDFPWMRKIFFAKDTFALSGKGTFEGTFHLFRETMPDGRIRTGRELKGNFASANAGLTLRLAPARRREVGAGISAVWHLGRFTRPLRPRLPDGAAGAARRHGHHTFDAAAGRELTAIAAAKGRGCGSPARCRGATASVAAQPIQGAQRRRQLDVRPPRGKRSGA